MTLPIRIELQITGIFIGYPYYNITPTAFSVSIQRGRTDFTQPFDAGVARIQFRNVNGDLDPDNSASPFDGSLRPGRIIRIIGNAVDNTWETDVNARPLFVGQITDVVVDHDVIGESIVTITAVDNLAVLAQQRIDAGTSFVEENTTDRIEAVLLAPGVDYPLLRVDVNYMRDNSFGQSICAAETVDQTNALEYARRVALTEQGEFFIRNQGGPFLTNRYWTLRAPVLTFSDSGDGINFEQIERLTSWTQLYNQLQANRTNENPIERVKLRPFPELQQLRFLNLGEVLLRSDAEVTDLLDFALVRFATPVPQIASLTTLLDDKALADQLALLALELADSVIVKYAPPGMSQLTLPCNIQSISHNYTVGLGWRVTFGFVPRDTTSYLVLDDATLGKLNENALAF
jgi:hypothetical protein